MNDNSDTASCFRSPFYWELSGPERHEAQRTALEDEGYLAHDLNYGAQLIALAHAYEPCADVTEPGPTQDNPYLYSDAIAAILQVAARNGYDPTDLCQSALTTTRSVYNTSAEAATSRRPHATRSD